MAHDVADGQPREGVGVDGHRVVEPLVAAEHLVGRLTRQGHRGVAADGAEQQVERGVHVAHADRQVRARSTAARTAGSIRSAESSTMSVWSDPTCRTRSWA